MKKQTILNNTIIIICLCAIGIGMLLPLIWMLSTSLKEGNAVNSFPPEWIPNPIKWSNYKDAVEAVPFFRYFMNSVIISVTVTFGQVLTSAMAAYAFSRLNFPGRDTLFFGYLATMIIPGSVTMIPTFILFRSLHLVDTYTALILPGMFSAYGTFMLRQFFMSLPRELEDAAKIDGCTLPMVFWNVILPLSKPGLATLATFTFLGSWNNFMWPLVVTSSELKKVLPLGLMSFQGQYSTQTNLLMAGSLIALIPIILVFLFNQRYFIKGIQMGAVKG
ncbi:MAG: carbohydrate ABC transporter permease [Abditibacteriota bacterium]|nr:carbohydrate ABC transporter permease [Abditibacteriota bacterium]